MELSRRAVLILGLGESGLAMARWCSRDGARLRVADTRAMPPMALALTSLDANVETRFGPFDDTLLDGIDVIAISPGLSPHVEPQRTLLATARARGIAIVSEIELFATKLIELKASHGYAPHVVGITGTNGKTTVTRLVGKLCAAAGRSVAVAGNISPPALDALADALDANESGGLPLPSTWVLELSSFQLETTRSLAPDVATVLNVTQDHLDWHGDIDAYAEAKRSVFAARTIRVLNRDDPRVMAMRADDAPCLSFGLDAPSEAGDFGVVHDGDEGQALRWLALREGLDADVEARGRVVKPLKGRRPRNVDASADEARTKRLMPVDALRLRGDHNVANVMAALAIGRAIGLSMGSMLRAVADYRGEPHRVQHLATIDDVDWIEDSKGTNVGATVAALRGLGRRVVLIAGGDGKGQDFTPLADPVSRHARAVVLIGRDAPAIRAALDAPHVAVVDVATLEDAVVEAARRARPGDAVLLSPACASLDMFRDYAHRAQVFADAVERLAEREATPC